MPIIKVNVTRALLFSLDDQAVEMRSLAREFLGR